MTEPARNWDPVVKLTHWSIALAVLANALITEEGSGPHIWVGYALAAILGLRLLWGLIGPAEARFSAFPPSPARALAHIREIRDGRSAAHRSHNPLGALMVYAIWGCLLVIIGTGIAMASAQGPEGAREAQQGSVAQAQLADRDEVEPREREDDADEQEAREHRGEGGEHEEGPLVEIHEVAANLLYVLILLHLAGVVFETRRSGRQIVVAMLPGHR